MKKRIDLYLPYDLYERLKVISKTYKLSITKVIIEWLEYGYIDFYKIASGFF